MATIKSYTDLQQSRKLAEILPLESADMLWGYYYNGKNHCIPNIRPFRDGRNEIPKCYIPAWSLAALLETLPEYNLQRTDWGNKTEYKIVVTVNEDNYTSKNYDNPIDTAFEMIIKLHELNLL